MKKPGMTKRKKQGTRGMAVFLGAALFCTSGVAVSAEGEFPGRCDPENSRL